MTKSDRRRYIVRFTGRVQGVGFRMTTVAQARGLDIHGFVRNESDGSVLMDAEGSEQELKELLKRIESVMSENLREVLVDSRPLLNRDNGFAIAY